MVMNSSGTMKHVQKRDNRWCIVDLVGEHGRVRTIPMPAWVKNAIDAWTAIAVVIEGHLFRPAHLGRDETRARPARRGWQAVSADGEDRRARVPPAAARCRHDPARTPVRKQISPLVRKGEAVHQHR